MGETDYQLYRKIIIEKALKHLEGGMNQLKQMAQEYYDFVYSVRNKEVKLEKMAMMKIEVKIAEAIHNEQIPIRDVVDYFIAKKTLELI